MTRGSCGRHRLDWIDRWGHEWSGMLRVMLQRLLSLVDPLSRGGWYHFPTWKVQRLFQVARTIWPCPIGGIEIFGYSGKSMSLSGYTAEILNRRQTWVRCGGALLRDLLTIGLNNTSFEPCAMRLTNSIPFLPTVACHAINSSPGSGQRFRTNKPELNYHPIT